MSLLFDLGDGRQLEIGVRTSLRAKRLKLVSGVEGVHAVVPPDFNAGELSRFVSSKRDWLRRTSRYYEKVKEKCGGYDPSTILFRGIRYHYAVVSDRLFSATVSDELKMITFHVPDRRKAVSYQQAWYRQQTDSVIGDRLPVLAEKMGVRYNRVSVKKQKSRWGSCSRKGNLNFNLMLSAAPPEVVDYIMIHELAHLKILDHSPQFWKIVGEADPQYRAHREWLSSFSPLIRLG